MGSEDVLKTFQVVHNRKVMNELAMTYNGTWYVIRYVFGNMLLHIAKCLILITLSYFNAMKRSGYKFVQISTMLKEKLKPLDSWNALCKHNLIKQAQFVQADKFKNSLVNLCVKNYSFSKNERATQNLIVIETDRHLTSQINHLAKQF